MILKNISKIFSINHIIGLSILNAIINFTIILHCNSIIHFIKFFIDLNKNFTNLLINYPPNFKSFLM